VNYSPSKSLVFSLLTGTGALPTSSCFFSFGPYVVVLSGPSSSWSLPL
jgi:hypothetical protein